MCADRYNVARYLNDDVRIRYYIEDDTGDWQLGTECGCDRECKFSTSVTTYDEVRVARKTAEEVGLKIGVKGFELSLKEKIAKSIGFTYGKENEHTVPYSVKAKKCYRTEIYYQENYRKAKGVIEKYKGIFRKNWKFIDNFTAARVTGINVGHFQFFDPTCKGCSSSKLIKDHSKWVTSSNIKLDDAKEKELQRDIFKQLQAIEK